jgi:hypothetical protein
MKRYFLKLALVAISVGTLVSCEEDTVTYGGQNFVTFDVVNSTSLRFFENAGVSEIPVNLAFPKSNDVTINFTVASDVAVAGVDYNVLTPGSVTIPAGQTSANIRIEVLDNTVLNDSKPLEITLVSSTDTSVAVGLTDEGSTYKRFLIVNNDCTTTSFDWYGTLNFNTGGSTGFNGTAEADVNDTGDCNLLVITGDYAAGGRTGLPVNFVFIPNSAAPDASGTVTVDEQLYCEACYTEDEKDYNILISGTGTYNSTNATNKTIIVSITATVDGLGSFSPSTTVFTVPAN